MIDLNIVSLKYEFLYFRYNVKIWIKQIHFISLKNKYEANNQIFDAVINKTYWH